MRTTSVLASLVATAAVAGAAHAQGSGSFSIQVNIPPLGAAMAAQDAGAVGAWTMTSPAGGLMIGADEAKSRVTIYRTDANRFSLMTPEGRFVPAEQRTESRGLTALAFNSAALGGRDANHVGFVIFGF